MQSNRLEIIMDGLHSAIGDLYRAKRTLKTMETYTISIDAKSIVERAVIKNSIETLERTLVNLKDELWIMEKEEAKHDSN